MTVPAVVILMPGIAHRLQRLLEPAGTAHTLGRCAPGCGRIASVKGLLRSVAAVLASRRM